MNHGDDYIFIPHGKEDFRKKMIGTMENYAELVKEYIPTADLNAIHDLKDGDNFDLDSVSVEMYACPGHTKGSLVMLIREEGGERFLLTGDACNSFTFLFQDYSLPLTVYEENLRKLNDRLLGKFNHVLASHGNGVLPPDIMDDVLAVCEDIKAGRTDDVPVEFFGDRGFIAKAAGPGGVRVDGGHGNIVYNKNRIR
jgi:glyoxylase-like metal-dependent hydrolase (beta-lactamase superfamily II)